MQRNHVIILCVIVGLLGYLYKQLGDWDLLSGSNENLIVGSVGLQLSVLGFCLFSAQNVMDMVNGHVAEDDYSKGSIYSILYSLYDYLGPMNTEDNVTWSFTFNTWGFGPSLYDKTDPERFGKTAYKSLILFDDAQKVVSEKHKNKESLKILEIGCGTGAGANLITTEILKEFEGIQLEYFALDMQAAAIKMCNERHASESLKCVQGNGMRSGFANNTFDIVIVSETHIAEIDIDEETKIILNEIVRVLKNNGLFLWGNALFTHTWKDIINYLPTLQFKSCGINNVTAGAIEARYEEIPRSEQVWSHIANKLPVFNWFSECGAQTKLLLMNFYRMPGTNMFNTMVNGTDSYMQICNQIEK